MYKYRMSIIVMENRFIFNNMGQSWHFTNLTCCTYLIFCKPWIFFSYVNLGVLKENPASCCGVIEIMKYLKQYIPLDPNAIIILFLKQ